MNREGGITVSFMGLLGLLFIALKLCSVIDWSWWLVLLPIYGPPLLILAGIFGLLILGAFVGLAWAIGHAIEDHEKGKRFKE